MAALASNGSSMRYGRVPGSTPYGVRSTLPYILSSLRFPDWPAQDCPGINFIDIQPSPPEAWLLSPMLLVARGPLLTSPPLAPPTRASLVLQGSHLACGSHVGDDSPKQVLRSPPPPQDFWPTFLDPFPGNLIRLACIVIGLSASAGIYTFFSKAMLALVLGRHPLPRLHTQQMLFHHCPSVARETCVATDKVWTGEMS